jgi:D-alanyl-D-alanine carboxypeptidase
MIARLSALFVAVLVLAAVAGTPPAAARPGYADLVIDAATGEVLRSRNAHAHLHPASLTKMMTLYLTFKALRSGALELDEEIRVSRHAASQPPSKLGLRAGSRIRVEDAIYAVVVKSANDIAVVLAEALGGSEADFARLMTQEAHRLGMDDTTFRNASGLPHSGQISSAADMGRLAQALIVDFPEYYGYFDTTSWRYRGATFRNHNRMIGTYPGMDGLKTGYIRASGFNLVASAVRGRVRLIAVVFGGQSAERRNRQVARLLDDAFASDRGQLLIASGRLPARSFIPPLPPRRPEGLFPAAGEIQVASLAPEPIPEPAPVETFLPPLPPTPPESRLATDSLAALAAAVAEQGSTAAETAPRPAGSWAIQVGAYDERAQGEAAMAAAAETLTDLLLDNERSLVEVEGADGSLYRARLHGFDRETAAAACDRLLAAGSTCLTIAPDPGT